MTKFVICHTRTPRDVRMLIFAARVQAQTRREELRAFDAPPPTRPSLASAFCRPAAWPSPALGAEDSGVCQVGDSLSWLRPGCTTSGAGEQVLQQDCRATASIEGVFSPDRWHTRVHRSEIHRTTPNAFHQNDSRGWTRGVVKSCLICQASIFGVQSQKLPNVPFPKMCNFGACRASPVQA